VASLISYEYSAQVSTDISRLSDNNIHSTAQIEASEIGQVIAKSLDSVSSNLNLLAQSRAVIAGNATAAEFAFDAAQNSTKGLTYTYFWLDRNGLLVLSSNGTSAIFSQGTGLNLSSQSFFTSPRETLLTFFSSATASIFNSSIKYIFVTRPVFASGASGSASRSFFNGVVGASIELPTLGVSLKNDLAPQFHSSFGLLDFRGTVLYSQNNSLIGENIFSDSIQSTIPAGIKPEFDAFLNQSLRGNAGFEDLSYKGVSSTLAYYPVFVNATAPSGGQSPTQWGVVYITAADALGTDAAALVSQAQLVSFVTILGISSVSAVTAFIVLRWNRQLDKTVKEKTAGLVAANEELAAKAKAERDLMNITAHELRTPTQSILANTEILRRVIRPALGIPQSATIAAKGGQVESFDPLVGDIQPSEMVEMVEASYRNAQGLQRLTQNILEVARIDNKTVKLEMENFDLNELLRETIEDMRDLVLLRVEKGDHPGVLFSFEQQKQGALLMVRADRSKVSEVLVNLLDNAARFSPDGGRVTVNTDAKDGFAVVKVSDEGPGIDPTVLPKLFTKFGTKTGTGLGLYICKAYVESQGGMISADRGPKGEKENEKKKVGATFTFTLPLAEHHSAVEDLGKS
jgi:signal transduction histidine kinase